MAWYIVGTSATAHRRQVERAQSGEHPAECADRYPHGLADDDVVDAARYGTTFQTRKDLLCRD
jgi:hypothetical protein